MSPPLYEQVRAHVKGWEEIGASDEVLRWIKCGVPLPLAKKPKPFRSQPIVLPAEEERFWFDKLEPRYLAAGAIRVISEAEAKFVHNAFLVGKRVEPGADPDYRPVVNLRRINGHTVQQSYRMEGLSVLLNQSQQHDYFIKWDLLDAFHHLCIKPKDRQYFQFSMCGRLYECIALPFGWTLSPWCFTKFLKPLVQFLRVGKPAGDAGLHRAANDTGGLGRMHISVLNYLDDFIASVGQSHRTGQTAALKVKALMTRLGLSWKETKCVWQPTHQIEGLGIIVDSTEAKLTLPARRVNKIIYLSKALLAAANKHARWVGKRQLASMVGTAGSARIALPSAGHHLQELQTCVHQSKAWTASARVRLTKAAMCELRWWAAGSWKHSSAPMHVPPHSVDLFTDASNSGWGAQLVTAVDQLVARGFWSRQHSVVHITLKELVAVRLAIESFVSMVSGCVVKLHSDATVVVQALLDLTSRSPALRQELRHLYRVLHAHNIILQPVHIAGVLNCVADQQSRATDREDWRLNPIWFERLQRRLGTYCTTDCFASYINQLCPRFFSITHQPGSAGVDSFSRPIPDWEQSVNWMNPPWSQLDRLATLLDLHPRIHGLVLAPWWPGQAWFQTLLHRCHQYYVIRDQPRLFSSGAYGSDDFAPPPGWDLVCFQV